MGVPVTDDEMYRQLAEDYRHHLRWREKLFTGFLVLMGALALAFYHTHKAEQSAELWFALGWLIPLIGSGLSWIFFLLERRCQEVLLARRPFGLALEKSASRKALFFSVHAVGRQPMRITHTSVLEFVYLCGALGFLLVAVVDYIRLDGIQRLLAVWYSLIPSVR